MLSNSKQHFMLFCASTPVSAIRPRRVTLLLVINPTPYIVPFRSYRGLLFKFWILCVLSHPLGQRTMFIVGSLQSA